GISTVAADLHIPWLLRQEPLFLFSSPEKLKCLSDLHLSRLSQSNYQQKDLLSDILVAVKPQSIWKSLSILLWREIRCQRYLAWKKERTASFLLNQSAFQLKHPRSLLHFCQHQLWLSQTFRPRLQPILVQLRYFLNVL